MIKNPFYINSNTKVPFPDFIKSWIVVLIVFLATCKITISSITDTDVWWHMQLGRDLVKNLLVFWPDYYFTEVTTAYSNLRFTALGDIMLYFTHCLGGDSGLIVLRVLCVISACLFLFNSSDKKITAFKIFILILMVVGTYQKQFIRNSLFALALFPLVLYFFENKRYIMILIAVSVWNLTHGSYLLGAGITLVLFISAPQTNKKLLVPLLIIFFVISWNNPTTRSFYSIEKIKHIVHSKSLNQTVFTPGEIRSADFEDPFKLDKLYIKFSFALGLMCMCLVRPKTRYILPFFAIAFLGLGYVRCVGYIAIMSVFLMLKAEKEGELRKFDDTMFLIALPFLIYFTIYHADSILYNVSKSGFNKCEMKFSDKNIKETMIRYGNEDTFNTMAMGGYMLYKWYPHKKVYIDTFWQPHKKSVQEDYIKYYRNPDLIPYSNALIGFTDYGLIKRMAKSKKWHAESIDQGSVLFKNKPPGNIDIQFTQKEVDKMQNYHKLILTKVLNDCLKESK